MANLNLATLVERARLTDEEWRKAYRVGADRADYAATAKAIRVALTDVVSPLVALAEEYAQALHEASHTPEDGEGGCWCCCLAASCEERATRLQIWRTLLTSAQATDAPAQGET